MKITKKITLITLLILSGLSVNAQDAKAKKILDDLSAKTKSYSSIKAEFSWIVEKKDQSVSTQEGILQTKGSKYKLEIPGHKIYCDGATVWDYIIDANDVQITDMEVDENAVNPSTIFTIYEKGYKYKFEGENGSTQVINLYPSNPDKKRFHTIKLSIDKNKNQITSVKMMMKDGTKQIYTIKSFLGNGSIADSDFVFNPAKHPGVSSEDLR